MSGVKELGKEFLLGLKSAANDGLRETKAGLTDIGDDLVDRLVSHIKYIFFYVIAAALFLTAAVLGLAEAFKIPTWETSLGLGVILLIGGFAWKEYSKRQPILPVDSNALPKK